MKKILSIASHRQNYSVHFVQNQNELLEELARLKNVVTIIDRNIAILYPEFTKKLSGAIYEMDALEQNKSLSGLEDILNFFQSANAERKTTVIVIGGGILQDTGAFAAHIFYRGLNVVFVPTTLLSMCDSCIGGKCGVNFNGYKNQLGAIHPPVKVLIWPGFLGSLSPVDKRSGCGELLKYSLLNGKVSYENFKQVLVNESLEDHWLDFIYEGLVTKKKIVEQDEFETGTRRLLNFGHTVGHAIERAMDHDIPHGIAVAKGIDLENYIAWRLGLLDDEIYHDVHMLIEKYFPCSLNANVTAEILLENTQQDKKIQDGKLNWVLMEDFGKFRIESIVADDALVDMMKEGL
ncbi:MAG TPA: 3-dehydroquinate synthase family protein [Gammaproteobacteria bacterium]|nr:3-dehydroquinate synthase family protein [Gammaproteobacteria bacterium]